MRIIRRAFIAIAVLCGGVFLATFPVERSYASRSQLIQRIDYDATNTALFGEPGPAIGSPQQMIIQDPKAFLKGKTAEGALMVNDRYLRERSIYPLQLKTVRFVANLVRWGCFGAGGLALIAWWLIQFSRPTPAASPPG